MLKSLQRLLDTFSFTAGIAAILAFIRLEQLGPRVIVTIAMLTLFCVVPSLVLRADRHIPIRGILVISGFLAALSIGVITLGLTAVALIGFPVLLAMSAAISNRLVPYIAMAATLVGLIVIAILFVMEVLPSPQITITEWNLDPRNWFILITCELLLSTVMIIFIQTLRGFWKETHIEAENAHLRFETLVEYAPDAILVLDVDTGQISAVNTRAQELFDFPKVGLPGGKTMDELSPEHQPTGQKSSDGWREYMGMAMAGGNPTFEWTHLGPDQTEIPCETSLSRLPPFERNLIRANVADITQRVADKKHEEELQAQLAASQRLETIGQLTGGVAHDFNNLLAVILGNLELLQGKFVDENQRKLLQPCIDATLRGSDLTRSMLSYARKAPLQPILLDINKLVSETKNWAGRTLPANIDVETSLLAGLWSVNADPSATESALLNLILNARDAMPKGGKLTIETSNLRIDQPYLDSRREEIKIGRYVMIAVSDNGEGIPEERLDKIFDPFFTTKNVGEGSGLGLPMVLGFMRQSGGTIRLYTELGVGTTFKLYFPAVEKSPAEGVKIPLKESDTANRTGRILFAEDNENVSEIITAMLEAAGYYVHSALTGDEAKRVFQADPTFDLLLTDIVMPGTLQGPALAKALRAINDSLPVIFMSGYASEATVHGNGLRPEDFRLMKPVRRRELLSRVEEALKLNS